MKKVINRRGFTLTEMLVVIALVAVIAVIAIPSVVVINRNINKRLLNSKVEKIQTAAELYGTDNPDIFLGRSEVKVYISELIDFNYVEKELSKGDSDCTGGALGTFHESSVGCVINPVNKESMNDNYVILKKEAVGLVAEYMGEESSIGDDGTLVAVVCQKLETGEFKGKDLNGNDCNCDDFQNKNISACLITGNNVNNYLKYENVMWRVMGIYNIYDSPTKLSAKMINDDNVEIIIDN